MKDKLLVINVSSLTERPICIKRIRLIGSSNVPFFMHIEIINIILNVPEAC